jgi:ribosomal protein L11 methyltransferase
MPTYSALTTLEGEDAAVALANAIERMTPEPTGVGVFEIEDDSGLWEVGAYFLEKPDMVMLEVVALAFGAKPFALSELPEIDWVAKVRRELSPVEAGRFFVYGSHDADKVPAGAGGAADRGDGGLWHRASRHDAGLPAGALTGC